jgi:hypothetical protein
VSAITQALPLRNLGWLKKYLQGVPVVAPGRCLSTWGCLMNRILIPVTACLLVLVTGCHHTTAASPSAHRTPSVVPTTTSSLGIAVGNRAPTPVETTAPGIQVTPPNTIQVTVGSHSFEIAADDWNTIFSKSTVPQAITLGMDPNLNATPTTTARFQYLADVIGRYMPPKFTMSGIGVGSVDGDVASIVAIINPSADAFRLSQVTQSITQGTPAKVITKGSFYTAAGKFLTLPPHSVYFAWWTSRQLVKPVKGNTSWHFHWDGLEDCHGPTCD